MKGPRKIHCFEVIMSSLTASFLVFAVVCGGAVVGMLLRFAVPMHHLSAESKDVIKLGIGLVGTMTALVLGLLISSAKGSFDAQSTGLTQASANIVLLDRILAHYGPETTDVRQHLRGTVTRVLDETWPKEGHRSLQFVAGSSSNEILFEKIQTLSPQNDAQIALKSQALNIVMNLGQTRWLMFAQGATTVSKPIVVVMVFWLTIIFIAWGLLTPPNFTVVVTMLVVALSVSSAILLILEMYSPYGGLIQVPSAPLRAALTQLGR
jgi:hypothetical protein